MKFIAEEPVFLRLFDLEEGKTKETKMSSSSIVSVLPLNVLMSRSTDSLPFAIRHDWILARRAWLETRSETFNGCRVKGQVLLCSEIQVRIALRSKLFPDLDMRGLIINSCVMGQINSSGISLMFLLVIMLISDGDSRYLYG
jgi:hypothetical protein